MIENYNAWLHFITSCLWEHKFEVVKKNNSNKYSSPDQLFMYRIDV